MADNSSRILPQCSACALMLMLFLLAWGPLLADEKEGQASASKKPLWEVGIGGFAGSIPHYPASDQNSMRYFAAPVPIYRGKILRVGEENRGVVSGRFIDTKKYEFDVTLSAAFSVNSGSNNAREGMPDLDFLFGIGPQLIFKLIDEPGHSKLNLNRYFHGVDQWDETAIRERGVRLFERAKKIWPFPEAGDS